MTASATNEKSIREAKARAKADADINRRVIQSLMTHAEGRRWIWIELAKAQIFVEEEDLDHPRMCFAKGIRTAGLRLLHSITTHCPDNYITMTRENAGVKLKEDDDGGFADSLPDE